MPIAKTTKSVAVFLLLWCFNRWTQRGIAANQNDPGIFDLHSVGMAFGLHPVQSVDKFVDFGSNVGDSRQGGWNGKTKSFGGLVRSTARNRPAVG